MPIVAALKTDTCSNLVLAHTLRPALASTQSYRLDLFVIEENVAMTNRVSRLRVSHAHIDSTQMVASRG